MQKIRHFLSITDLSKKQIIDLIKNAILIKKSVKHNQKLLIGKTMAMIFEKPSLRTRVSFEAGMTQMGGHAIYLSPSDIGIGTREPAGDIAQVLSGMTNIIMARTFKHQTILDLAQNASVPVINALSDLEHPCQILADLMTIYEIKRRFKGLKISFVGDGENNVTHSLALSSGILGINFACGSPKGYQMMKNVLDKAREYAKFTKVNIVETTDPKMAVQNSDVVITDTWVSMGDELEKSKRIKTFKKYQVNRELMSLAKKDAIFMHCLPAYRGNEVTSEVIDGPQSVVFHEAENRLHSQKALIAYLLNLKIKS